MVHGFLLTLMCSQELEESFHSLLLAQEHVNRLFPVIFVPNFRDATSFLPVVRVNFNFLPLPQEVQLAFLRQRKSNNFSCVTRKTNFPPVPKERQDPSSVTVDQFPVRC